MKTLEIAGMTFQRRKFGRKVVTTIYTSQYNGQDIRIRDAGKDSCGNYLGWHFTLFGDCFHPAGEDSRALDQWFRTPEEAVAAAMVVVDRAVAASPIKRTIPKRLREPKTKAKILAGNEDLNVVMRSVRLDGRQHAYYSVVINDVRFGRVQKSSGTFDFVGDDEDKEKGIGPTMIVGVPTMKEMREKIIREIELQRSSK